MSIGNSASDRPNHLLHTMIRVSDLERSVAFYRDALCMRELRREDYPTGKFTLAFLGFGDETCNSVIELTYNYDDTHYSHGSGFGHMAFAVADIALACERLPSAKGLKEFSDRNKFDLSVAF
jgi:lactoylglutathione lyase